MVKGLEQRLADLPRYSPRVFVPDVDLTRVEEVVKLCRALLDRPIVDVEGLKMWIRDRGELETVLDQVGSVLYVQMTCQTDHESYAKAYEDFIQTVVPAVQPLDDQMNKKYLEACERLKWNDPEFDVYNRALRMDVELFREKNVPLQTEIQLLSQEYQKITGAMTVTHQGQEKTLPQMSKYLLEPDRKVREEAWRLVASRRLQDAQKLEELFSKMLKLRHQVALNAGFSNYRDYKFKSLHRFDYTPRDCEQYHDSIRKFLLPIWKSILQKRRDQMKVDVFRPWDTNADPLGRPPLKPFVKSEDLIAGCQRIFNRVDPELGVQFKDMSDRGLLDLDSRKGKAPGGYQSGMSEARKPFIFMNAVGTDDDVRTLLHEGGHAFHTVEAAHHALPSYRHAPMEFCEVASMSMELFGGEYLNEFYSPADARRSMISHIEDIVYVLVWVAVVDAFQHWIYLHPDQTPEERKQAWLKTYESFGTGVVDWSGFERERAYLWHRQLHVFEVPFYYIEYGIAQLGALQLWLKSRKDFSGTVKSYRRALALGGSKPLPRLFAEADLVFGFETDVMKSLSEFLKKELGLD